MADKVLHATRVEVFPALPAEADLGARLTRRARVVCSFGCDLKGAAVSIRDGDGNALATVTLSNFRDAKTESEAWTVQVPDEPAATTLTLAFEGAEGEAADHAASEIEVTVTGRPGNTTSLAVWGLPAPLVAGGPFRFKVGAKSSSGHSLAGCTVSVRDDKAALAATATLGAEPWAGTDDLYWAEVEAAAPATPRRANWSVELDDLGPAAVLHQASTARFSFTAVPRPDSGLIVRVMDAQRGSGLAGAEVRLRSELADGTVAVFGGTTDEAGLASVAAPAGRYRLVVWKANYTVAPIEVTVGAEAEVELTADFTPSKKQEQVWM